MHRSYNDINAVALANAVVTATCAKSMDCGLTRSDLSKVAAEHAEGKLSEP